jgi:ABC-2 type transport system ATP-binding protein
MAERVVAMVDGRLAAVGSVATIRAAMTDKPRQVFIECDDARRLASALIVTDGVVGVHVISDQLRVEASDASDLARRLPRLCLDNGIDLTRVEPADESLESVFRYLVEGG